MPENVTEKNMRQIRAASKLIRRKQRQYETQNLQFAEMREDAGLKEYLNRTTFINKDGEVCEFTDLQKHDLNLVLQKRYALLNWQQGSGKTAASITGRNTCSSSERQRTSSYLPRPSPPT